MTSERREELTELRLEHYRQTFRDTFATPQLCIGMVMRDGPGRGEMIACTVEGVTRDELVNLLRAGLRSLGELP